ncbi:MAG: pyrroline-5-carboxylate reductase [Nitrospirota bacterium]|nr:pyrroline-5-carboxylate reductase [Nitrospirota bacterium]
MAEALLGGLLAAKLTEPAELWATDPSEERRDFLKQRFGIHVGSNNHEAVRWADIVLLAVKPQVLDSVLHDASSSLSGRLIISIAAGISIRYVADRLPAGARIVRVMPNAPAMVREGMSVLAFGPTVTDADRTVVRMMFESVGRVALLDEPLMDAVTGLSGSGPAYIFMAIEALADGGVKMGLPRAVAELLAAQTAIGAARTVLETGEHPGRLKDRVASPGGTTIAGLHQLEQGGLRASLMAAVRAATERARELGQRDR